MEEFTATTTITLPEDKDKVRRLRLKLEEYKTRLSEYSPPEAQFGTICKIAVLETLLEKGTVDVPALWENLRGKYVDLPPYKFIDVVEVINCYATGQEDTVHSGTGLPE